MLLLVADRKEVRASASSSRIVLVLGAAWKIFCREESLEDELDDVLHRLLYHGALLVELIRAQLASIPYTVEEEFKGPRLLLWQTVETGNRTITRLDTKLSPVELHIVHAVQDGDDPVVVDIIGPVNQILEHCDLLDTFVGEVLTAGSIFSQKLGKKSAVFRYHLLKTLNFDPV